MSLPHLERLQRGLRKGTPLLWHLPQVLALHRILRVQDTSLLPQSPNTWTRGVQRASQQGLARAFTMANRLSAFLCHQRYEPRLRTLAQVLDGTPLSSDGRVVLGLTGVTDTIDEGCSVLEFRFEGVVLYRLTFTIVPGRVLRQPCGVYLFVGGSQGVRGRQELIRQAARCLGDISPATVAFLGLQALGSHLGATGIAATSARFQMAECHRDAGGRPLYDELWEDLGGVVEGWYYSLPLEPHRKDLGMVSSKHRRRARARQERRTQIYQCVWVALSRGQWPDTPVPTPKENT